MCKSFCFVLLVFLSYIKQTSSSAGDYDPLFRQCKSQGQEKSYDWMSASSSIDNSLKATELAVLAVRFCTASTAPSSMVQYSLFRSLWTVADSCDYYCMHWIAEVRRVRGRPSCTRT